MSYLYKSKPFAVYTYKAKKIRTTKREYLDGCIDLIICPAFYTYPAADPNDPDDNFSVTSTFVDVHRYFTRPADLVHATFYAAMLDPLRDPDNVGLDLFGDSFEVVKVMARDRVFTSVDVAAAAKERGLTVAHCRLTTDKQKTTARGVYVFSTLPLTEHEQPD